MVTERRSGMWLIAGIMCVGLVGCNLNDFSERIYLPNYEGNIAFLMGRDTLNAKNFIRKQGTDSYSAKSTIVPSRTFQFQSSKLFNLDPLASLQDWKNISLVFNTVNEFPFAGEIDLIFLDEQGNPVDSLKNNPLFDSPVGRSPVENTSYITLDRQQVTSLNTSSKLKIITRLSSSSYQYQELHILYPDYSLIMSLSVSGQVSINLSK